jgi:hypothetical protein
MLCHLPDDLLCECACLCRCTNKHVGLDFLDDRQEIAVLLVLPLAVFTGISDLSWRKLVFLALEKKTGLVDTPVSC